MVSRKRLNRSMTEGPLLPNIILYTIPIILTTVLQLLFNAADMVVVGNYCGSISLAAVGATSALTMLVTNLFMGLSVGAGVTTAQNLGAKDDYMVQRTVHTTLPVALISGAFLSIVGVSLAEPLLRLMGTPENVLPLSAVYMRVIFSGMIFNMVYNFCSAVLRAAGDTKSPLFYLTIAGVLNVGLNVIFVTVLDMNVAGVALATIASQALSAVMMVVVLMRRHDACRLELRKLCLDRKVVTEVLRIGLPSGINGCLFAFSNTLIQSSINSFGDVLMSGNAAAANIEGFVSAVNVGFYQASINFSGQNTGAKRYDRVKKSMFICMTCSALGCLALSMTAISFGEQLLGIYITDSPQAIAYGMIRMYCVCSTFCFGCLMDATTGTLRGMGISTAPMIISLLGVCGTRITFILTLFQLPQFHNPQSLYLSYPVSWLIVAILEQAVFFRVYRKRRQALSESTG